MPPYYKQDIQEPVKVRVFIVSGKDDQSRKASEPHEFTYVPINPNNRYFAECGPHQTGMLTLKFYMSVAFYYFFPIR